jgi:hypothetical protein
VAAGPDHVEAQQPGRSAEAEPAPACVPAASLSAAAGSAASILALQRCAGNRATREVLARQPRRGAAPAAAPAALPGTLIGALPQAQRLALREVTDQVASIPLASLAPPPGARSGGATVSVTPAPELGFTPQTADVRRALNATVSHLISGALEANTTSAILLDLQPYGGENGIYRFTYVTAGGATRYLVDFVQAAPTTAPALLQVTASSPFSVHSFAFLDPRSATTGTAAERQDEQNFRQAVVRGVDMIPDAFLGLVDGLRFQRLPRSAQDAQAGGDYSHQTHTVTIYDRATSGTVARFDDPGGAVGVGNLVRAIVHEIGHAIDQTRIRGAHVRLAAARRDLQSGFGDFATTAADGSVSYAGIPGHRMRQFNQFMTAAQRADTAYTSARGETGSGWESNDIAGARTRFTRALTQAGPREITAYAGNARGEGRYAVESFAEAFSLYVTEPETLRALRPSLHAYFTDLQANPAQAR